jgi:RNA polymerase sigma-70 factor (ECF subfamily)
MGLIMSIDTRSNDELLEAARQGEMQALTVLLERHWTRLERMVRLRLDRRLQGRVDSADVVQEAYLTVWQKFPRFVAESRIPFYL